MFSRFDFFSEEQNILLALVRESLFGKSENIPIDSVEFSSLWKEAEVQTVPLLALNNIESESASPEEKIFFKNKLQSYFFKNISVGTEHTHLHSLLADAGIPYVIIKGMASAVYYPDELMRLMGDVDFIVKEEDKSIIIVFYGKNVGESEIEELRNHLENEYPIADIGFIEGKQDIYDYIISLE